MDNPKQSLGNFAVLSLFLAAILCLHIWSSSISNPLVSVQKEPLSKFKSSTAIDETQDELGSALAKASMGDKTMYDRELGFYSRVMTLQELFEELFDPTQQTLVAESVFFFSFSQKLLENRMAQLRHAHDKSFATLTNANHHVSGGDIGGLAVNRRFAGFLVPLEQQLADSNNVMDFAAFTGRRRHFLAKVREGEGEKKEWMAVIPRSIGSYPVQWVFCPVDLIQNRPT